MPVQYVYLILAIIAETVGKSALQASQQFTRAGPTVLVVVAYAIAFFLLGMALKYIPVGIAYAIWSGLGIVCIALIGYLVFGQKLDLAASIGLGLIVAGIVVIQVFSRTASH
jgi:small multidrug resistance pump